MPDFRIHPEDSTEPKLPPELVNDLRAVLRSAGPVPPDVDDHIRAAARQSLVRRRRQRLVLRWVQGISATAAVVGLGVWLAWPASDLLNPAPSASPLAVQTTLPPDARPDRRLDIVDAFALARQLERHTPVEAGWDLNRDGRVDRQDVDVIAARAVSLEERVIQ